MAILALCPGSFDPPTNGHLDVIRRGAELFDRVLVAVVENPAKTPMFTAEERVKMLTELLADVPNVTVESFSGLLVVFAGTRGATVFVKGLRGSGDFEYELAMAQMNRTLSGLDTVFIPTSPEFGYVSSSLVREVAVLGGSVDELVPPVVAAALKERR